MILYICNTVAVGLFGIILSAAFCNIRWDRKNVLWMAATPVAIYILLSVIYFGIDTTQGQYLYPIHTHLALAIVLTGVGVALTVNMRLVPNPGDGIVQALSDRTGWELGLCKNLTDGACFLLAVSMCMLTIRRVIGIGIGTVLSMVVVGRVLAVVNRLLKERMCRAAGVEY